MKVLEHLSDILCSPNIEEKTGLQCSIQSGEVL